MPVEEQKERYEPSFERLRYTRECGRRLRLLPASGILPRLSVEPSPCGCLFPLDCYRREPKSREQTRASLLSAAAIAPADFAEEFFWVFLFSALPRGSKGGL